MVFMDVYGLHGCPWSSLMYFGDFGNVDAAVGVTKRIRVHPLGT